MLDKNARGMYTENTLGKTGGLEEKLPKNIYKLRE